MAGPWWLADLWQPFKWSTGDTRAHSGVDKGMPCGSVVASPVAGRVLSSDSQPWGGQIDLLVPGSEMPKGYDPTSQYVLSFLHTSREDVRAGQSVSPGQQIGLSGQPPPGQGFGSGCHVHFEVTHGDTAPYRGQYSPWHPTNTSYPVNGQPFIDWLGSHGLPQGGPGGIPQGQYLASDTSSSGGGWDWGQFWTGVFYNIPVIGGLLGGAAAATNTPASAIGKQFASLFGWITNPLRMFKLVIGSALILIGMVVTFLPDAAAITVAAAGAPEAAPAVRSALASKGKSLGQKASSAYVGSKRASSNAETKGREKGAADEVQKQRLKRIAAGKKAAATRRKNKAKGQGAS